MNAGAALATGLLAAVWLLGLVYVYAQLKTARASAAAAPRCRRSAAFVGAALALHVLATVLP